MSLRKSLLAVVALAFGLTHVAPAFAQGASTTTTTTTKHTSSTSLVNPLAGKTVKAPALPKVDLNTATKDQLMALPGIGDAIADKIVAARPFANKHQLLDKGLVNKGQYAKMAPHIIASQASVTGAAKTTTTVKKSKTTSVGAATGK
jgi:DNA uptake protein ComE-like DNA-binding protein